jgi:hypothetical protein
VLLNYVLAGQDVKSESVIIQFNSWNLYASITDSVFLEQVVFVSHLAGRSCVSEIIG